MVYDLDSSFYSDKKEENTSRSCLCCESHKIGITFY